MTSTDPAAACRAFFVDRFVPAADRLRARGVSFFPPGPDDADSWYLPYPAGVPEFDEVEPDQCADRLARLWQGQGFPELADLAGPLLELSLAINQQSQDQPAEVSPFIYAMY